MSETTEVNESMLLDMDGCAVLKACLDNFFEKVSSVVSEQQYCDVLGKVSKNKAVPIKVRNKMKTKLFHALSDEVTRWIEEEKINDNLKTLDKIVEEYPSSDNAKAWRPNGNVEDHIRSVSMATKLKYIAAVDEDVKNRERVNESLREKVLAGRSEVKEISRVIQTISDSKLYCHVIDRLDQKVMESVDVFERELASGSREFS